LVRRNTHGITVSTDCMRPMFRIDDSSIHQGEDGDTKKCERLWARVNFLLQSAIFASVDMQLRSRSWLCRQFCIKLWRHLLQPMSACICKREGHSTDLRIFCEAAILHASVHCRLLYSATACFAIEAAPLMDGCGLPPSFGRKLLVLRGRTTDDDQPTSSSCSASALSDRLRAARRLA